MFESESLRMARRRRRAPVGPVLHVYGRGCAGRPVLGTDDDKGHFLYLLEEVARTFEWRILDWVLMSNHHHLVLRLSDSNLSVGMKRLHGLHAVAWNDRHGELGHAWQGRFGSIVVNRPGYAERLIRYVDLNPVRAGLVRDPGDWHWGGYRAAVGLECGLPFHDVPAGRRLLVSTEERTTLQIQRAYRRRIVGRGVSLLVDGVEATRPTLAAVLADGSIDSALRAIELWEYGLDEVALRLGVHRTTLQRWRQGGR